MANKAKMVDGHKCALHKDLKGYLATLYFTSGRFGHKGGNVGNRGFQPAMQ